MKNLQEKSHQALLTVLNNIGFIGSILAGVADIIFVIIFVFGINVNSDAKSTIAFAITNAFMGLLINILLRYQGIKYAEIENQDLLDKFYRKKVKEIGEPISIQKWQTIQGIKDFIIKGVTTTISISCMIYISIQGSNNPIEILITLATLILFVCFGLISMNSGYTRFYNIYVPYMEMKVKENEECQLSKTEMCIEQNTNN